MLHVRELRALGEALAIILVTWLLLGWYFFDRAITQADGSVLVMPLLRSALEAGPDWTEHLYRVGVIGGSKMHEFAGTMPVVQLCSVLGLSTTAAANTITVYIQLCFAFFGVLGLQALVRIWAPGRELSFPERVVAAWSFAFMPLLAWRYAYGHENLLLGLLPLWVTVALLLAARARVIGMPSLAFAAFAVANGVSGLGPQTLAYSVAFGTPFVVLVLLDAPAGERWRREHWIVAAVLAAAVLIMLPRLAPMFAHAVSDDASRALGESVKESFGTTAWRDWAGSLPWTHRLVASWQPYGSLHEHNFAIGPYLLLLPLAWARGKRLVLGIAVGVLLAIVFAQDVEPIASLFGFLDSFRVPARAVFPAAMFIPLVTLAAWFSRVPAAHGRTIHLSVLATAALLPLVRQAPALVVEILAWSAIIALLVVLRRRSDWLPRSLPALSFVTALGVVSFEARFPRHVPIDTIEHGPQQLHDAAVAQAPEVADPIHRVLVTGTTAPFSMSTAFAAGLGSLDGVWYPPKRFLALLSTLTASPVPSTACVFDFTSSAMFPVLQQLYNVRYLISLADKSLQPLPPPLGAAWFPRDIITVDEPRELARALAAEKDFRPLLQRSAWVLAGDPTPRSQGPRCSDARVEAAASDGQAIAIDVVSPEECVLVVATNYVSTFRAIATVRGTAQVARVFPLNIALTGIAVPAGANRVLLEPHVDIPRWTRVAQIVGFAALVAALGLTAARWRATAAPGAR